MKKEILFLIMIVMVSCSKGDNNNSSASCTQTMAKIAGTYSFSKIENDIASPGTFIDATNDLSYVRPCVKDNKVTFNADGTATYLDAGTACSPSLNDNAGTWSLPSAGKITISFPSADLNTASNADIVSFDCTTLVILVKLSATESMRITFKK